MNAKRLTYTAPTKAIIEDCVLGEPNKDEVMVRSHFSAISRGTERLIYQGLVPQSEHETMRCPHQVGNFTFPISYGYSCVGQVMAKGQSVTKFDIGDHIFVLHPHQDMFLAKEAFCTRLPNNTPPNRSVLAANMETALNAIWDAQIPANGKVSIIGAGVLGLLTGYLVKRITDITPSVIDINPKKENIARALGLEFFTPTQTLSPQDRIFNTSSSGAGLQSAIDISAFEAHIIEMSWYGNQPVTLNLGGAFHSKRLSIISSQVGHVSPHKRNTTSHAQRMAKAISYLDDPKLDNLLQEPIAFKNLPSHLHEIFNTQADALCQVVKYNNQ